MVESPNSRDDQNLLLAPWGPKITIPNGNHTDSSPVTPTSPFQYAQRSPGGTSVNRYCIFLSVIRLISLRL